MEQLHDVNISQNVRVTTVTVDGLKIKGLTDVNYSASVGCPSKVTIEFYVGNLNVDEEEK